MADCEILKVVVASPGDVQTERNALEDVIAGVNRDIESLLDGKFQFRLLRWETDVHAGFHLKGTQALIESVLKIADCDVLIGIFWMRFGQPVAGVRSHTEREIKIALK